MTVNDLVHIDDTGYHYADYPTVLAWLQDQYKGIYGADVYLEADSQDGEFLAVLAKAMYDSFALGASGYNARSPKTAQGVGLSTVVKINGISRRIATNSTVDVLIVGTAGTVITNGIVQDTLNQKWNLPASVTIPGGGSITVTATAQNLGAVSAIANSVNKIFTPTLGWQTVNNPAAATLGAPVEKDAELRARQAISVANPSLTVFEGTVGAVANVSGVTAVRGYENPTGSTDANGVPAHSICVVAANGDALTIAETIALHKTPGTGTFGGVTETVYDSHGMPLSIKFQRPTTATISVRVTLSAGVGWTTDYETLIAKAVADVINAFGIGSTILISKLYAPAYLLGTPAGETYDITLIEIKKNAGSFVTTNIALAFDELPNTDYTVNVTFVVT